MEPPLPAQAACGLTNPTTWCAHQSSAGISGDAEDDDRFGAALAFGDFNGDGFADLAIGVPGQNAAAGAVHVFYSNGSSLALGGQQLFDQDDVGGETSASDGDEGAEDGDEFGFAVAAGDFDDDGFDDLAVGSPGEDLPDLRGLCEGFECTDAGGVHVVYGGVGGLQLATSEFLDVDDLLNRILNPPEFARTGAVLAVADIALGGLMPSSDGFDDLVVGAPSFRHPTLGQADGKVFIGFGDAGGLATGTDGFGIGILDFAPTCDVGSPRLGSSLAVGRFASDDGAEILAGAPTCTHLGTAEVGAVTYFNLPGFLGAADLYLLQTDYASAGNGANDHFGAALAAGDFDGDGLDDLAAAAPNKNHGAGNPNDSGRVYVAYSSAAANGPDPADGPDIIGEDEWAGDTPGAGEHFGSALAAGDVDGDGFDDLLAGAPGEGTFDVGRVYLKRGSASGLTIANNALFTQTFLGGSNGDDDHLGNVIALGDVDGDGALEVALGVPDKDVGAASDAGMVYVTRAFGPRLFSDGFESGNKAAWSTSTP